MARPGVTNSHTETKTHNATMDPTGLARSVMAVMAGSTRFRDVGDDGVATGATTAVAGRMLETVRGWTVVKADAEPRMATRRRLRNLFMVDILILCWRVSLVMVL